MSAPTAIVNIKEPLETSLW